MYNPLKDYIYIEDWKRSFYIFDLYFVYIVVSKGAPMIRGPRTSGWEEHTASSYVLHPVSMTGNLETLGLVPLERLNVVDLDV